MLSDDVSVTDDDGLMPDFGLLYDELATLDHARACTIDGTDHLLDPPPILLVSEFNGFPDGFVKLSWAFIIGLGFCSGSGFAIRIFGCWDSGYRPAPW